MASELGWRVFVPFAILIALILAVALSEVSPRQGRYLKLFPALMIFASLIVALMAVKTRISKQEMGIWAYPLILIAYAIAGALFSRKQKLGENQETDSASEVLTMLARRIVAKHVTQTTALAMLGATAVLAGLQVLFTYLGELGSLKEGYGGWDALKYVLWEAPKYLYEILPISALIGAVLGLGTLASNSELIVMRSVGVSLWRIVGWVIRSALLLVVLSFALSEWVIPYTTEQAKSVKSASKAAQLGEVRGYWTRRSALYLYRLCQFQRSAEKCADVGFR